MAPIPAGEWAPGVRFEWAPVPALSLAEKRRNAVSRAGWAGVS